MGHHLVFYLILHTVLFIFTFDAIVKSKAALELDRIQDL